jgi:DNA-binding SARP family transcriptional activator
VAGASKSPQIEARADQLAKPFLAGEFRLCLLDSFDLTVDGGHVRLPLSAQRLLAFLALHDRPLLRLHVSGVLWPDTPEERSCANLRSTLWRLRQPRFRIVEDSSKHLRLAPVVMVDIRELIDLAHRLNAGSIDFRIFDGARLNLSGELLPDWYDDWVLIERERLHQMRLHALEHVSAGMAEAGRFADAVEAGLAAVAGEPLRESAQRVLIRAYMLEGNQVEAVRQFHRYKSLLQKEIGLKPGRQIEDLLGSMAR